MKRPIIYLIIALAMAAAVALLGQGSVSAQTEQSGGAMSNMGGTMGGAMGAEPVSEAMAGYMKAMQTMMMAMHSVAESGDADIDFVRGMIPHHQAAIDMAKVQLEFGKDPEIRKLSEAIIAAQEAEIAQMNKWLEAHPAE